MRAGFRLIVLTLWTAFCVGVQAVGERFTNKDSHPASIERWKLHWVDGATRIFGLVPKIVPSPHATQRATRGRLVLANHRSPFDVVVLMRIFSGHFLANARTQHAGVVGKAAVKIGTVFVDRSNMHSGASSIRMMRKLLREGRTVIVFPEGTTRGGDTLRQLHQGAFVAARGLDVDVLAVGLAYPPGWEYTEPKLGKYVRRVLRNRAIPIGVAIGEPMPPPDKQATATFAETLQALVHDARRRLEQG